MFLFSLHQLVIVLPQDGLKDFLHHLTIKTVVLYTYEGSFSGVLMLEVMNSIFWNKTSLTMYSKM